MFAQPTLDRSLRRKIGSAAHTAQFNANAPGPPARMTTTQFEGRLQQWWRNQRMSPTGPVPGLHCGRDLIGLCSRDAPHQVANRAQRQAELPGNVRGVGSEPCHAGQSQPYVGIRRARH
jgi:hypothetical protein